MLRLLWEDNMKVYLATDHSGVTLKNTVKTFLEEKGYVVEDCGAYTFDKNDDYPDFITKAAKAVSADPENSRGIIFGGSGQGEAIVANKFAGVRCAIFSTPVLPTQAINAEGRESTDPFEIVKLTREHNGANMLSLAVRFLKEEDALHAVQIWLETANPSNERHLRRIEKIKKLEETM